MSRILILTAALVALAACSGGTGDSMAEYSESYALEEASAPEAGAAEDAADAAQPGGEIPVSVPQITN